MDNEDDQPCQQFDDDDDDEENWMETGWAEPGTSTGSHLPFKQIKQTSSSPGTSSFKTKSNAPVVVKSLPEEKDKNANVVSRMALNDNKAGMVGLDRDKINKIIMEASAGSKFYENERKKAEQMNRRIEEQRKKLEKITEKQLIEAEVEADTLLKHLDATRDLSRTIVHIDMDAFFAAVEMKDNPSLKDKPMAVGGNSMLSTSNYVARRYGVRAAMPGFIAKKLCPDLVIVPLNFEKYTAVSKQVRAVMAEYDPNYCPMSLDEAYLDLTEHLKNREMYTVEQRTFEMPSTEDVADTQNLKDKKEASAVAPSGISVTRSGEKPEQVCDEIHSALNLVDESLAKKSSVHVRSSPEAVSSDEELDSLIRNIPNDITPSKWSTSGQKNSKQTDPVKNEKKKTFVFGLNADEAVREMRLRIELATGLTASAGIAPNMMLAKVCSDRNKPNGQYRIPPTREAVLDFIGDLPIRKICGIGKVSETMLKSLDVTMCHHLYEKRAVLYHLYSAISFNYFMRICIGIGSTKAERDSERKSMSVERTFSEINKPADLYKKCLELSEALAEDLQGENLKGRTVTIKLKTVTFEVKTRAQSLMEYTSDAGVIFKTARELLRLEIEACQPKPLRLRLLGVRASNFQDPETVKKKQRTIMDMFQRAPAEKSTKAAETGTDPTQVIFNTKDENANNVVVQSRNEHVDLPKEKDGDLGEVPVVKSVVLDSEPGDVNSHVTRSSVEDSGENDVTFKVMEESSCRGDDSIHTEKQKFEADVEDDPVYLLDTDVDSDTETMKLKSEKCGEKTEPSVVVCDVGAVSDSKSSGVESATCNTSTEKIGVDITDGGELDKPVCLEMALEKSRLSDRHDTKEDGSAGVSSGLHYSSENQQRGCNSPQKFEPLLDGQSVDTRGAESNILRQEPSIDKEDKNINCRSIEKMFSQHSVDRHGCDGAKPKEGLRKESKKEAFQCPVCNETVFCKDMMDFNKHLDNCLCGNTQSVSQNLRSQNSTASSKGRSAEKKHKVRKGSGAKASKKKPNMNVTLDKFMFKQEEHTCSVNNFSDEDSHDFLSYEESFAEEPSPFGDEILSDEDILGDNITHVLSAKLKEQASDESKLFSSTVNCASLEDITGNQSKSVLPSQDTRNISEAGNSLDEKSHLVINIDISCDSAKAVTAESSLSVGGISHGVPTSGQSVEQSAYSAKLAPPSLPTSATSPKKGNSCLAGPSSPLPNSGLPSVEKNLTLASLPACQTLECQAATATSATHPVSPVLDTEKSQSVEEPPPCLNDSAPAQPMSETHMKGPLMGSANPVSSQTTSEPQPMAESSSPASTSSCQSKPDGPLCPICGKTLRTKNLDSVNRHIDLCLSGRTRREPKRRKRKASYGGQASKRYKRDDSNLDDVSG